MTIRKPAECWNARIAIAAVALICGFATAIPARAQNAEPPAWTAFKDVWENVTSYSATVIVFEREGTEVQSSVLDYTFRKPSSATVHFTEGPNAGVTVVWNGSNTVVIHRGTGLIALFKKTFSLHDPRVTTIRLSSIDQLSFAAILAHAKSTPGIVSQDVGPSILDIPTEAVTLVPTSSLAGTGITREVVDISVPTGLPLRILGYEGDTLVRQIDFSNIILRP
jgi:outer membrane lipoprotein-sorting protein